MFFQLIDAIVVGEEVEEGEEDAEGLLHAQEAVKGPFAVVLNDRVGYVRGASEAGVGDDMLAGVVAFGGAVPEEDAPLEGWKMSDMLEEREGEVHTDLNGIVATVGVYACLWPCQRTRLCVFAERASLPSHIP